MWKESITYANRRPKTLYGVEKTNVKVTIIFNCILNRNYSNKIGITKDTELCLKQEEKEKTVQKTTQNPQELCQFTKFFKQMKYCLSESKSRCALELSRY